MEDADRRGRLIGTVNYMSFPLPPFDIPGLGSRVKNNYLRSAGVYVRKILLYQIITLFLINPVNFCKFFFNIFSSFYYLK
jgi:hypothetical protein